MKPHNYWLSERTHKKCETMAATFLGIAERGLISPNHLSALMMHLVLPAKLLVPKQYPLETNADGDLTESGFMNWVNRSINLKAKREYQRELYIERYGQPPTEKFLDDLMSQEIKYIRREYNNLRETHDFKYDIVNGIERLQLIPKEVEAPNVEVEFGGNAQDCISHATIESKTDEFLYNHYVFWNYPGVGCSAGLAASEGELFTAAEQLVEDLIQQGIPADSITLNGFSLGGAVAIDAALKLNQKGHGVHLKVQQSFSDIARVIPAQINLKLEDDRSYLPLASTTASTIMLGLSIGTALSGFISTVGLGLACTTTAVACCIAAAIHTLGQILALAISAVGRILGFLLPETVGMQIIKLFDESAAYLAQGFDFSAVMIADLLDALGEVVHLGLDLIGSFGGGAVALSGALAGLFSGLAVGALLSIQNLWTDEPKALPMTPAFSLALASINSNIHSASKVKQLIEHAEQSHAFIELSHSEEDSVIPVEAALPTGLDLPPGKANPYANLENTWFEVGDHGDRLLGKIEPREPDSGDEEASLLFSRH